MRVIVLEQAVEFRAQLPAAGSLLAIDASRRRLGIAGTDPGRRLVTPLMTLLRNGNAADIAAVRQVLEKRAAVGLVVGLPLNMDGTSGPMARAAHAFARALAGACNCPLLLQDERLTTFAVETAIAEGRLQRPRRGQPMDHYAAAVILEDALRAMKSASAATPPLAPG